MNVKMTVDEALGIADECVQAVTLHEGSKGWRVVCMVLAAEVRQMRKLKYSLDGINRTKKENLILNLQLLNIEQNFIELKNKAEGLVLQNELLRKELARERGQQK